MSLRRSAALRLCRSWGWTLWCMCACAAFAAHDEVQLTKGGSQAGTITRDEIGGVDLRVTGGATVGLEPANIKNIVWDIGHTLWQTGLREMQNGNYADAAAAFQSIAGDPAELQVFRPVAKPYLLYLVGDCLYKAGRQTDAVDAFEKFIEENKASRYVPMALGSLVDAAIQSGKLDKVPKLLDQLSERDRPRACLFGGEVELVKKNIQGAENKFSEAASSASDPETKALGRLGQARCAVEKKDLAKARQMAEQALGSSASPAVAGTAYLIIGNALSDEAAGLKGDAAVEKNLDAVLSYLRVWVVYGNDKRSEPEALFRAGECFVRLSKFKDRGADRDRAVVMFGEVMNRYKTNRWAAEAQKSLAKMKP